MRPATRPPSSIPGIIAGALVFAAAQVRRAAHRPDLPSFTNQDISGTFGDPGAPTLRIVAVGDSSLTAPGLEDLDAVWLRRIALEFARAHRVELTSLGVGGSKACDVIEGQLQAAVALEPDIALVTVGSNDAMRAVPPRRFRRQLEHIVDRLAEASGAVVVMGMGDLGSIPRLPRMLRLYLSHRSRLFDDICTRVAISRPITVKVYTRGIIISAFRDDPTLFAADLFHAGDEGHAVFAAEAMPAFRAALAIAGRRQAGQAPG